MRPLHLELEGFGPYRTRTAVDLTDCDLFAVVGPTGAGKSTLIDAICFALYGAVPRYDDRGLVAPVISLGALQARVALRFSVGGRTYLATRVVRNTRGKVSTKEARLERVGDAAGRAGASGAPGAEAGVGEVLAGRVSEMGSAVEAVVGLGFEEFTRSVVLPQGAFARLLHERPAERQELIGRLLGLDAYRRVGQRARQMAAETRAGTEAARRRVGELAGATEASLAAARARVGDWQALADALAGARTRIEAIEQDLATADAEARRLGALAAALDAVQAPADLAELTATREGARAALEAAERAEAEATADAEAATAALVDRPSLEVLEAWGRAQAELAARQKERAKVAAALEQARAVLADAQAELEEARAALAERQRAHTAHALRATLVAGAPCPVCEQPVTRVPKGRVPALGAAERRVAAAEEACRAAEREERRRTRDLDALDGHLKGLAAGLDGAPPPDELAARREETRALVTAAQEAERAAAAARRRVATARRDLTGAEAALAEVAAALRPRRDAIVAAGGTPPHETGDAGRDWPALLTWVARERPGVAARLDEARGVVAQRRTERDRVLAEVRDRVAALGRRVDAGAGIAELAEIAADGAAQARAGADRIAEQLAERERLEREITDLDRQAAVAETLGEHLRASQFEAWLLTEALERLAEGAGVHLEEISRGRFTLGFDPQTRDFQVIDHAHASERRPVRTLSGGETFLASLALALALADQLRDLAADATARLEAVFLDEGFGTLDADSLEVVAGAIENLAAGDRMVGIVTHVPDLAERMPVQLRVIRTPDGARVEKTLR